MRFSTSTSATSLLAVRGQGQTTTKFVKWTGAAAVFLLVGTMAAWNGQSEKPAKPDKVKAGQEKSAAELPARTLEQAQAWQKARGWLREGGGWAAHDTWPQSRAHRWYSEHRTWAQRGGYGGAYVPKENFRLHFGSDHVFRISSRPVMYLGYPRLEHGGVSFLLVDPWPEYWPDNWYEFDDVYIDYSDGYYLYNPRYPQVKLAIAVAS